MTDSNDIKPTKRESYALQLQSFANGFLDIVRQCGLPAESVFVHVPERATVFKNINVVLAQVPFEQRTDSIYLS